MRIIKIVTICLLGSFFLLSPLTYGQPKDNDINKEKIESLLKDLDSLTDDADQRMIAHPTFIEDLRNLVSKYREQLRTVFLFDDFSDGDFTNAPDWNVRRGEFSITPDKMLKSSVMLDLPPSPLATSPSEEEISLDSLFSSLFGDDEEEETTQDNQQPIKKVNAVIESLVQIGTAFEIDFSFISDTASGAMEIALLGGAKNRPLYRLIYPISSEKELPIRRKEHF